MAELLQGRYRVIRELGRGGLGVVLLVHDAPTGREIALKKLALEGAGSLQSKFLKSEFKILAGLAHPNLVQVYDFSSLGETPDGSELFFTSEFIDGQDILKATKDRPLEEIYDLTAQLSRGLEYIHSRGIVHGDIKPQNILVTRVNGQPIVKLLDFGLAKVLTQSLHPSGGTFAYMAPEVPFGIISPASDLYSLGVVLFEMVTRTHPLKAGPTTVTSTRSIALLEQVSLPDPRSLNPKINEGLARLIIRLTAQEPKDRFSRANFVIRSLNRFAPQPFQEEMSGLLLPALQAAPFIGRKAEFSRLKSFLEAKLPPSVVIVLGKAGVGKSRLVREFKIHCQVSLIDFEESEHLLGSSLVPPCQGDPQTYITDLMCKLRKLKGLQVLHVNEFQSAEETEIEILKTLARQVREEPAFPVMLLLELDSDQLSLKLKSLIDDAALLPGLEIVSLQPFTQDQTNHFVSEATGLQEIPPKFSQHIYRLTGGHPSYLVALLRRVAATQRSGEPLRLKEALLEGLPPIEEIHKILFEEYKSSTVRGREILDIVSLIRGPVSMTWLFNLIGGRTETLIDEVRSLSARQLLKLQQTPADFIIQLDHELMREVIGQQLPKKRKAELHDQIASLLERVTRHQESALAELAHHFTEAGNKPKALHYNLAAGVYLKKIFANQQAIRCFELALSQGADPASRVLPDLARLYELTGNFKRAAALYGDLAELLESQQEEKNLKQVGLVITQQGLALQKQGDLKGALESYRKAIQIFSNQSHTAEEARVFGLMAMIQVEQGDFEKAIATCREGLRRTGAKKDVHVATIHNALGLACYYQGDVHEAVEHYSRSLEIYETLDFKAGIANAANNLGMAYHQARNRDEALRAYQKGYAIARARHDNPFAATILANIATVHQEKGEYQESLAAYEETFSIAVEMGNSDLTMTTKVNLATLYILFGAIDTSEKYLQELSHEANQQQKPRFKVYCESLHGDLEMVSGNFERARDHYAEAARQFLALKMKREALQASLDAIDATLEMNHLEKAEHLMKELPEMTSLGVSDLEMNADHLAGRLAIRKKPPDLERAEILLGALDRFLAKNLQPERQWQVFYGLAELCRCRGDDDGYRQRIEESVRLIHRLSQSVPEEYRDDYLQVFRRKRVLDKWRDLQTKPQKETATMQTNLQESKKFTRLLEINRRMNSERDTRRLLEAIMDAAIELTGARRGFLILYEKKPGGVFDWKDVKVARNFDQTSIAPEEVSISSSVVNDVLKKGQVILTDNATLDERFANYKSIHDLQLNSILAVPLKSDRHLQGVLYVDHPTAARLFAADDVELVTTLADLAVVALRNVKDFEEQRGVAAEAKGTSARLAQNLRHQSKEISKIRAELLEAKSGLETRFNYSNIIGQSAKMREVFKTLDRITNTTIPVVIYGESGTGKELVAKALHYNSSRKTRHFVSENCTAIPENLLESELFGHVKGAFTGADKTKEGLFRYAHGGTLFLDEIGDMPLSLQSKLLRVLQEGKVRPVGGNETVLVDARVVSASHRHLKEWVQAGHFREDLFYRLNGITISLPPLRERREDIPLLVRHFIERWTPEGAGENRKKAVNVPAEIMELLVHYPWPGNIRELEQTIRNAVLFASHGVIDRNALSFKSELFARRVAPPASSAHNVPPVDLNSISDDREKVIAALKQCRFNKSEAAKALGVTRKTLYNKLERYGITENVNLL